MVFQFQKSPLEHENFLQKSVTLETLGLIFVLSSLMDWLLLKEKTVN